MIDGTSSCIPGRLLRFEDAHHAACDGLVRRAGDLDEALATYRATCEGPYRVGTADAVGTVDAFRGGYRGFATWVGEVGRGFARLEAIDAYINGGGVDLENVSYEDDAELAAGFDERFADDPFLGVPAGPVGPTAALAAEDQDEPPPWVEMIDQGSFVADTSSALLEGAAKTLLGLPDAVEVTLRVEGSTVVVLRDGTVVGRFARAELTARLVVPKGAGPGLASASRWLGRAANTATFILSAGEQFAGDAGLAFDERLGRATTRGLGVLGGSLLGAQVFGTGAAAGCASTVIGAPVSPLCGAAGAIVGGIVGAIGGDWLVDQLPWMDPPPKPLPLEYDLDELTDIIGRGQVDGSGAGSVAAVDLAASEIARNEAAGDAWDLYDLQAVLPDPDALADIIDPPTPSPTPGTTSTTTTTVPPPSPLPTGPPSPSPGPAPTPTPSAPPTGTTTTTIPGGG